MIAVYTDIGRGHPNYLDSVLRYLRQQHPDTEKQIERVSVFDNSRGVSLQAWRLVGILYRTGSRGGIVSTVYGKWRSRSLPPTERSVLLKILGRDIKAYLGKRDDICVVEHPIVARIIGDQHPVCYIHGEIAAPPESAVPSVERVYVPLPATAQRMIVAGVRAESVATTGLLLEPELCVDLDQTVEARLARLQPTERSPLTIGFFVSGAYPAHHIAMMVAGALSCSRQHFRVRMFWGCDKQHALWLRDRLKKADASVTTDNGEGSPRDDDGIVVISAASREEETIRSVKYVPQLDLFCAAPHERVNWAVGAGLPMIAIAPPIGTFAPENLRFLLESGCGITVSSIAVFSNLGEMVLTMREEGSLDRMCRAGRSIDKVNGTQVVAEDLLLRST